VYFIYGQPGLGKSTTARYLARRLDAWLCLDFEELRMSKYQPVNELRNMQKYVQPSKQRPLVIILDELDEFFFCRKDDEEKSDDESHPLKLRCSAMKKNWGRLLDTIHQSANTIFICTSNKPKSFFDDFDSALLRPFRVTSCLHYQTDSVTVLPK